MPDNRVRQLEEAMADMLPPSDSILYDGWLLRFSPGKSRNTNSVWPIYPGHEPTGTKIEWCERQYEARGLACSFRLSEGDDQSEIQDTLGHRGYAIHNPNSVLTNKALESSEAGVTEVSLNEWLDTMRELDSDLNADDIRIKRGPLSHISLPTWYGHVDHNGETCSYGRAVQQEDLFQLAELWTKPDLRGQGFGTRLIQGLLHIGRRAGARTAFLPVSESNDGARRLYDRLGFKSVYGFKYLIPPPSVSS